jgi:ABC-type phosphate transport system substrate-binding protein
MISKRTICEKMISKIHSCFLIVIVVMAASLSRAQDVLVVANPGVQIKEITSAELRDIFTGVRSTFRDHSRAVPVLLKGGPVHEVFLRNHVSETPDSFRALWRKAAFTGQGIPPREFSSEAALLDYVAETPGAIGYVSRLDEKSTVRIIPVQKKAH